MSAAYWQDRVHALAATRDGLRARLTTDPGSSNAWLLERDLAATERAIAHARAKLAATEAAA